MDESYNPFVTGCYGQKYVKEDDSLFVATVKMCGIHLIASIWMIVLIPVMIMKAIICWLKKSSEEADQRNNVKKDRA